MCWRAALAVTPPSLTPPLQPGELMAEAHHTWSLIIGFLPQQSTLADLNAIN